MTGKISLTASMRSNLLSLQNISRQVSSTQNKLATGNKVNSAIDNPSSNGLSDVNSLAAILQVHRFLIGQFFSAIQKQILIP